MTNVLVGINNFVTDIYENWTLIIVTIGMIVWMFNKFKNYMAKSDAEKVNMAWDALRKEMLSLVSKSEVEWGSKTGQIKRSEVIGKIFDKYPILKTVTNEEEVIAKIDDMIKEALKEMDAIFKNENVEDAIDAIKK